MDKRSSTTNGQRNTNKGFSLIELMVAMGLGLFVILGITGMFQGMRTTYATQDGLSNLQDNQRMAMVTLSNIINNSGYFPNSHLQSEDVVFPAASVTWSDSSNSALYAGQTILGLGNSSGSDKLAIRFQSSGSDSVMDCLGRINATGAKQVRINIIELNAKNELTCKVDGSQAFPLVAGVGKFNITYGVDADKSGSVDVHLPAAAVNAGNLWAAVMTVSVSITYLDPILSKTGAPVMLPNALTHNINIMGRT